MDPERARELLARERARIERTRANLGRDVPADKSDDPGDEGSELLYQNEFDAGFAEDFDAQYEALKRAEARLEAGTYGLSVESGEPIPDERLEAYPTAERTTEEQRRLRERG